MRQLVILALVLLIGGSCGKHSRPSNTANSSSQATREVVASTPNNGKSSSTSEPEKRKEVPREFTSIDFKNRSYPITWKHQTVTLKDGRLEFYEDKIFYNAWFNFDGVDFLDLNGDGKPEAIVQLDWVSCGASCYGGSSLFYFYAINRQRTTLLSRLELGSVGYDCGLKSFVLKSRLLTLETFRPCRFNGVSFQPTHTDRDERGGKFLTNRFTRFTLYFNGSRFVQRTRKVFPHPEEDFRGYQPTIEISDE